MRVQAERSPRGHAARPAELGERRRELDRERDAEEALEADAASFPLPDLTLALAADRWA